MAGGNSDIRSGSGLSSRELDEEVMLAKGKGEEEANIRPMWLKVVAIYRHSRSGHDEVRSNGRGLVSDQPAE